MKKIYFKNTNYWFLLSVANLFLCSYLQAKDIFPKPTEKNKIILESQIPSFQLQIFCGDGYDNIAVPLSLKNNLEFCKNVPCVATNGIISVACRQYIKNIDFFSDWKCYKISSHWNLFIPREYHFINNFSKSCLKDEQNVFDIQTGSNESIKNSEENTTHELIDMLKNEKIFTSHLSEPLALFIDGHGLCPTANNPGSICGISSNNFIKLLKIFVDKTNLKVFLTPTCFGGGINSQLLTHFKFPFTTILADAANHEIKGAGTDKSQRSLNALSISHYFKNKQPTLSEFIDIFKKTITTTQASSGILKIIFPKSDKSNVVNQYGSIYPLDSKEDLQKIFLNPGDCLLIYNNHIKNAQIQLPSPIYLEGKKEQIAFIIHESAGYWIKFNNVIMDNNHLFDILLFFLGLAPQYAARDLPGKQCIYIKNLKCLDFSLLQKLFIHTKNQGDGDGSFGDIIWYNPQSKKYFSFDIEEFNSASPLSCKQSDEYPNISTYISEISKNEYNSIKKKILSQKKYLLQHPLLQKKK